jgi:hypothetical protein
LVRNRLPQCAHDVSPSGCAVLQRRFGPAVAILESSFEGKRHRGARRCVTRPKFDRFPGRLQWCQTRDGRCRFRVSTGVGSGLADLEPDPGQDASG